MAKVTYLEFEKPVAQLEEKIQELRDMSSGSEGLDLTSDINGLEKKNAINVYLLVRCALMG